MDVRSTFFVFYRHFFFVRSTTSTFPLRRRPFHYDTSEEQSWVADALLGQTLHRLINASMKKRPKGRKLRKRPRKNEGDAATAHQTNLIAACDAQIKKRKEAESVGERLVLPIAQVDWRISSRPRALTLRNLSTLSS